MPKQPFQPAKAYESSFNCPFCNAFSQQNWIHTSDYARNSIHQTRLNDTDFCFCTHCGKYSIWYKKDLIYPELTNIEPPNDDLEEDIVEDYKEALSILQKSPRGAAALLRLAVQKLCVQLGENGKNINTDIGNLVKKGLPPTIQRSLDALRVIGNEQVHPGHLDLRDKPETAHSLFRLLNKIAEVMITEPKEIQAIYDQIPESKKVAIEKRDKK